MANSYKRAPVARCYQCSACRTRHNKALALEVYARQARNTDAETKACEIRLRAERRVGQLLKEREMAKGSAQPGVGRKGANGMRSQPVTALSDLGISKNQSSRWQKLASIPDRDFEASFETTTKPSTAGIIATHTPKASIPAVDPRAACEIRLRAERRVGQLLQEREKAKGAQGTGSNQHEVRYQPGSAPPLAELGISHNQSSRWQRDVHHQPIPSPAATEGIGLSLQLNTVTTALCARPSGNFRAMACSAVSPFSAQA